MIDDHRGDGVAEVARALTVLERNVGGALVGVYLYGSCVAAGPRPRSDVDLLIVSRVPTVGHARRQLVEQLMAISGRRSSFGPSRPLDVTVVVAEDIRPWRFPPVCDLLFGEWLRDEFESGRIAPAAPRPDLAIVLTALLQDNRRLAGLPAAQVFDPVPEADLRRAVFECLPSLLHNLRGDERNVMLTLARMWVTLATGAVVSKEDAGTWATDRLPVGMAATIGRARSGYLGLVEDDWSACEQEVDALVGHLMGQIDAFR